MNNDISKRYKFSLDSKSNNTLNNGQLLFNYGDDITLEITVTDGGITKNIAGCEVDLITANQNSTDVLIHHFSDGGITVREDNTIVIVCKSDYVDRLGTNVGQLIIRDEDQSITTQMFSYQTSTTLVSDEISGSVDGINTIEDIMKVIANANLEIENFNRVTTGLDSKIQATNTLVDNLTDRVNIEITSTNSIVNQVKLEESKRVQSEDTRSSNEVSRVNSEYTRVQNEHVRSANEQDRVTKETQRVQSETARESAENDRVSEENIRKTNEISRVNSESDRVSKEKERVTEEEARKVAENSRKSAETTRAQSESQRVQSENTRSSNESNRVAKETERVNNENARKTAETARVSAETSRKNAELARVTAEAERVAAEKYRADKFYEMEHEYDESITAEVVDNRQGYDGVVYANMYEARKADYEKLDNKFGDFTHSKFSGIGSFKADNTKEGLVKDINVKGRTLQNLFGADDPNVQDSHSRLQCSNSKNKNLYKEGKYTIVNLSNKKIIPNKYNDSTFLNTIPCLPSSKTLVTLTQGQNIQEIVAKYEDGWTSSELNTFLKSIVILEGDHTNTPLSQLPYGEGIYSVGEAEVENGKYAVKVKSYGKNLYKQHINKTLSYFINELSNNYIKTNPLGSYGTFGLVNSLSNPDKELFTYSSPIFKGKTYSFSCKIRRISGTGSLNYFNFFGYNKNQGYYNIGLDNTGSTPSSIVLPLNEWVEFKYTKIVTKDVQCVAPSFQVSNTAVDLVLEVKDILLEESITSTNYEPYKESSIKYLLDEPLRSLPNGVCDEIVGNKLIRRIGEIILDGTQPTGNMDVYCGVKTSTTLFRVGQNMYGVKKGCTPVSDKFPYCNSIWGDDIVGIYSIENSIDIRIPKTNLEGFNDSLDSTQKSNIFKTWLSQNPTTVYYELATPIITDIGIKTLKGYDGVTNIFMNNTLVSEISAKVPMDITSEIEANRKDFNGNLYPSMYEARRVDTAYLLDKINNAEYLEKTGCDITATNSYDGLTKDLSVKGRTLQNLNQYFKEVVSNKLNLYYIDYKVCDTNRLVIGKTYTIIYNINIKEDTSNGNYNYCEFGVGTNGFNQTMDGYKKHTIKNGLNKIVTTYNPESSTSYNYFYIRPIRRSSPPVEGEYVIYDITNFMILEGDYSNTPLSELPYIEGIKSTGEADVVEGKYPISVKSCGKNMIKPNYFDGDSFTLNGVTFTRLENGSVKCIGIATANVDYKISESGMYHLNKGTYTVKLHTTDVNTRLLFGGWYSSIPYNEVSGNSPVTFSLSSYSNVGHFRIRILKGVTVDAIVTVQLEESSTATPYEPYRESSIKYLLDEPLRSLPNGVADEIIGNQLIRRVGKVVLNGSEDWRLNGNYTIESFLCFNISLSDKSLSYDLVCDKFAYKETGYSTSILYECCSGSKTSTNIFFKISNSKLTTQDVAGFKTWLASNPTTVYYELATPIITTLDQKLVLNTYDTTTHITSDNTLLPTITTKVPSNVQAVVANLMEENKELNNQVSTLSVENEELKATNEVQDEMIDVTMCATDEMFNMLEPLLAQVMEISTLNTNKEVVNPMVDMYVAMVQRGLKTIDQVPARYREQVEAILAELDK